MSILFWGLTIGTIGKVFVALCILRVHQIMAEEQKIDARVIRSFKTEKAFTAIGVVLIVIGYVLEIYFYGLTPLLSCYGTECSQAAAALLSQ
jgi:pilus assembly protein TadC